MVPYFVVAGAAALLTRTSELVAKRFNRERASSGRIGSRRVLWTPFDFALVALLVAFSGLRFDVGTDLGMYLRIFSSLNPQASWGPQLAASPQEAGYTFLSLLVKSLSHNPQLILWTAASLTVVPVYIVIKKMSLNITLSITLYIFLAFYVAPFNLIRQGIAVSLLLWAYSFLGNKKGWVPFILLASLASTFHVSSLIVAMIMVLARLWKPTALSVAILLGASASGFGLLLAFPGLFDFMGLLNERYDSYLAEPDIAGLGTYLNIGAFVALLIVSMSLGASKLEPHLLGLVAIGIGFLILGTQSVEIGRFYYYFLVFTILLLPNVLAKRKTSAVLSAAILVGAAVYFAFYLQNFADLIPYKTAVGV